MPKYPIPVLEDYNTEIYPLQYWGTWEKFPLNDGKADPWINTTEFRKQLTEAGIDPNSDKNRQILSDLQHGANIGASGRARLPTSGKNTKLAYQYGSWLQEALQELLLEGAMQGPLDRSDIPNKTIKLHSMAAKLKPNGKVRSIMDCSGPRTEEKGTPRYVYNPDYQESLNSTIQKSEFPVDLTSHETDLQQRERIVGKVLSMSQLLESSKHGLGPIFDFGEGSTLHVVEETLSWWTIKVKHAIKAYPIPKPGPRMSGDLINAWTDAARPSLNHVRGVGVAIPGYG